MSAIQLAFIAVAALCALSSSQYIGEFCKELDEVIDTNMCPHGALNNSCDKLACLKGLGESCDAEGDPIRYGDCASGLFCACRRCVGCIGRDCNQESPCLHTRIHHRKTSKTVSYNIPAQQLEPNQYRKRLMKIPLFRFGYEPTHDED